MAFKDHRDFFELLDKEGELLRIKQEVDWDIEAGAIGRKAYEMEGPCILFEKIKDYHNKGMISNGTTGTWLERPWPWDCPRPLP
jgi:4-hydroxy-3-polyprenylbenzoate decarboxylase